MTASKETRAKLVKDFQKHDSDSGSAEVQIALLTEDIKDLTEHMKLHPKDYHSRRGLIQKVGRRNKLLGYLNRSSHDSYLDIIKRLGLRR